MTLNKFLRWTAIIAVFGALFVPFLVADSMFFPFITGKNFTFRILTEIGFAAWLLLSFRDVSVRPKKSLILLAMLAFTALIGIADIFGQNPWKSFWSNFERMEGYITTLHLLMYFIVASSVLYSEKIWQRFLEWSVWLSLLMSGYGFLQLIGKAVINQGGVRVDAKFGNATYFAIYLIFNIFFALILIYRDKKLWKKICFGLIAVIHFIMLYHTATRGAMLGLIGGLLLSALILALFQKQDKKMRLLGIWVTVGIIVLVIGFLGVKNASFVKNSPVLSRFASISINDTKTQARAYIWPMAIKGFLEHPILGRGQENFNYVFNANYNPKMYNQEQWFDHTHDTPLDWLVSGGLLGLLSYLSIFAMALYLLWRRSGDVPFMEKSLLTGLLAAYFFHNLFVFDNIVSSILFMSVLSLIHYRSTKLEKAIAEDTEEIDTADSRMLGGVILVCLAMAIYFFNYRGIETSRYLIKALQAANSVPVQAQAVVDDFGKALSYDSLGRGETVERLVESVPKFADPSIPVALRQKFYEMGRNAVENQLKAAKGDARYEVFAGNFYASYSMPDEAEKHYLEAAKLSPNKQSIFFQLGSFYVNQKKYDKAVETYKKAYELEPSYEIAGQLYAMSLLYAGREDEARAFLKSKYGNIDFNSDLFLQAYANVGAWSKVISILKQRIAMNPGSKDDRMNLVSAYYQSGDNNAAIAALRDYISYDPTFKAQGEAYIKQIQAGK